MADVHTRNEAFTAIAAMFAATLAIAERRARGRRRLRPTTAATRSQESQPYDHDLAGTRFSPLTEINAG